MDGILYLFVGGGLAIAIALIQSNMWKANDEKARRRIYGEKKEGEDE
jgi:hypothetical protein